MFTVIISVNNHVDVMFCFFQIFNFSFGCVSTDIFNSISLNTLSKDYLGEIKAETDLIIAAKEHGVDRARRY